jgi:hypothetical protein
MDKMLIITKYLIIINLRVYKLTLKIRAILGEFPRFRIKTIYREFPKVRLPMGPYPISNRHPKLMIMEMLAQNTSP